jgi:type 1 glutamine amidotransferase
MSNGMLVTSVFGAAALCTALWTPAVRAADYPVKELTAEEKAAIDQAIPGKAPAKPKKARKVLLVHINKRGGRPSSGHPSIPHGNYAIMQMGRRTGAYEATINNDESAFRPENLADYDLIIFNNTVGILFEDPRLRQSLLDFVKNGKGFAAFHAGGGATFVQHPNYDHFPEFGVMVGGYEDGGHPWLPKDVTHVKIDDPKSPLTAMFKGPFQIRDESWIKPYGKGRVFYTATGHDPSLYRDTVMLQHYLAGIQFALGDLKADMTPSAKVRK